MFRMCRKRFESQLVHLQQEEVTAERRAKRAEAFVAPDEEAAPTIDEKRKRKHAHENKDTEHSEEKPKKKKKKRATEDEEEE